MAATWPIILFLDIDGVLNGHDYLEECRSSKIDRACVQQLNRILKETDARIVLSSAWRYQIHGHAMTLNGFQYMLQTHGIVGSVNGCFEVIQDLTCRDEDIPDRRDQIAAWLAHNSGGKQYVILDDIDFGFAEAGMNFVQTEPTIGLTEADADRVIALFRKQEEADAETS
jgi:hypothetical protein